MIDGAVHGVQAIWDEKLTMEEWGFLPVDTKNAFKNINRMGMLWTAYNLLPSRDRFVFNFYRHWPFLVLQNGNDTATFMRSIEGVTQGDPCLRYRHPPTYQNPKRDLPDVTKT